uniref:Uncharacterized protein n=1 Tax=Strongyloides papillosus TaxID=174720 RepID=A0A0N5CFZ6_STREA
MNIKKFFFVFAIVVTIFGTTANCNTYILDDVYDEPHQVERMKPKRAINPFMDSIGKRNEFFSGQPRRYFDVLAGQSLGKRSSYNKK